MRRLLKIVYNLFLELWMSGVYFFDFFLGELCHSFCPWHITRIDDFEPKRKFIRPLESWNFCLLIIETNWREIRAALACNPQ